MNVNNWMKKLTKLEMRHISRRRPRPSFADVEELVRSTLSNYDRDGERRCEFCSSIARKLGIFVPPLMNYREGTQPWKIYQRLTMHRSVTNKDLILMEIYRYGGRLDEMRDDLEAKGWTIRTVPLNTSRTFNSYVLEEVS